MTHSSRRSRQTRCRAPRHAQLPCPASEAGAASRMRGVACARGKHTVALARGCYDRRVRSCWLLAVAGLAAVGCGRIAFDRSNDASPGDGLGDGALGPLRTAYLKPSNTEAFDDFGYALAVSADG